MRQDAKIERLRGIPLFAHVPRRHLGRVAALSTDLVVEAGRVLCRVGQQGDELFVVEEGTFAVLEGDRPIATLGPGDFFGELALLGGGPRTATVRAETAARVLVVGRTEFNALLREEPGVAVDMLPGVGEHVRRLAERAAAHA